MQFEVLNRYSRLIILFFFGMIVITFTITSSQLYISDNHYIYDINITLLKTKVSPWTTAISNVKHQSASTKLMNKLPETTSAQDSILQNTSADKEFSPNQTKRNADVKSIHEQRRDIITIDRNTTTNKTRVGVNGTQLHRNGSLKKNLKSTQDPKIVIILAYMHTGSSYTGSIIKNRPGTFYEYEPLKSLQGMSRRNFSILYLDGTIRKLSGEDVDIDIGAEAVSDLINCKYEKLDIATLTSKFSFREINYSNSFYNCVYSRQKKIRMASSNLQTDPRQGRKVYHNINTKSNWNLMKFQQGHTTKDVRGHYPAVGNGLSRQRSSIKRNHARRPAYRPRNLFDINLDVRHLMLRDYIKSCLPHLTLKCKSADIRLSKFIRLRMEIADKVLAKNDEVRIIHLLRDPRSMMDSELRKNDLNVKIFENFVQRTKYICSRMQQDLSVSEALKKSYPGRIFTFRYEDLVDNPYKTAQRIFDFIGVPFTSGDKEYIKVTSIEPEKNATFRAHLWRHHITQMHLEVVNKYCSELYSKLGYLNFKSVLDVRALDLSDHLKNFTFPN